MQTETYSDHACVIMFLHVSMATCSCSRYLNKGELLQDNVIILQDLM